MTVPMIKIMIIMGAMSGLNCTWANKAYVPNDSWLIRFHIFCRIRYIIFSIDACVLGG